LERHPVEKYSLRREKHTTQIKISAIFIIYNHYILSIINKIISLSFDTNIGKFWLVYIQMFSKVVGIMQVSMYACEYGTSPEIGT